MRKCTQAQTSTLIISNNYFFFIQRSELEETLRYIQQCREIFAKIQENIITDSGTISFSVNKLFIVNIEKLKLFTYELYLSEIKRVIFSKIHRN